MSGYTSDQLVAHATGDGLLVPRNQRARLTGIQASASSASSTIIFKSGGSSGTVVATFLFGTEGIDFYVPGSGILFDDGIYLDASTDVLGVTITFT